MDQSMIVTDHKRYPCAYTNSCSIEPVNGAHNNCLLFLYCPTYFMFICKCLGL